MDWNKEVGGPEMMNYWDGVGRGVITITTADIQHLSHCKPCQHQFLAVLHSHHLKITSAMMAAIIPDDFKQEVVRALCLRALDATVGN